MEEAAVKSLGARKKRHRGRKLAAKATQRAKGSDLRRKLADACRKVSHHAAVGPRKRNVFKKIQTQGNCGPQEELATVCRRMTHSTKVARCGGHYRKRYNQDNVVQETQKGRTFRKRCWKGPECNNGIRGRGIRQQL
jgi:hypothetical protein